MPVLELVTERRVALSDRLSELAHIARGAGYLDVVDWANSELCGYRADVPTYRHVKGVPMGYNPVKGWVPLYGDSQSLLRSVGCRGLRQSVSQIEEAIRKSVGGKAYMHYPATEAQLMSEASGHRFAQMATCLEVCVLDHVLSRVGSLTTNWINQIEGRQAITPTAGDEPPPPAAA